MAEIEYFYSAHSAFAYLGSSALVRIAREGGHQLVHRPMDLRAVVAAAGATPTRERTAAHRAYFFGREILRWAEERGVAVMAQHPTHHHHDIARVNGLIIAARQAGHAVDALAHALLEAHWRDDADLDDPATLESIAVGVGLDGAALIGEALSPEVAAIYEANTREAIERSVFGSPTYFVDGDMFYGQDHLDMVARALRRPYAR